MDWLPQLEYDEDPPDFALTSADTALLVIDVQFLDAHPNHGIGRKLQESGDLPQAAYYFEQVTQIIPRIRALQDLCRTTGIEVIHTRLCATTDDERDISPLHKSRGWSYPPGSREVEFLPEVAPAEGEIVIDKTASGPFNSTNIDQLLRNLGVRNLLVCGVDTCYCVETTVRDAADRGYNVVLVGDACATKSPEMQADALRRLRAGYCTVRKAAEVEELVR